MRYFCACSPIVKIYVLKAIDRTSTFRKRMLCAWEDYSNWTGKIYSFRFENGMLLNHFYNYIVRCCQQIELIWGFAQTDRICRRVHFYRLIVRAKNSTYSSSTYFLTYFSTYRRVYILCIYISGLWTTMALSWITEMGSREYIEYLRGKP